MVVRKLKKDVFEVGALDPVRKLFDALIPLPEGTSYNSYLIQGSERSVLIDTVEPVKLDILKQNLIELKVKKLDYIVSNHAEQDHSGSIPEIMSLFPEVKLIVNQKGYDVLKTLLDLPHDRIQIVEDREKLSLGNRTVEFIFAPWVHWPETMFSYLHEDKILFSCDLFGSHLASNSLFCSENTKTLLEAKRYYAEIMMPFANRIGKHLDILQEYDIEMIAPSHGPVYDEPSLIIDAYRDWISERVRNEVVLLFISMHGSTEKISNLLMENLKSRGIDIKPFNLVSADIGDIALATVDAATIVFATPAVLMGPHPAVVYTAYLINTLKPKTRFVSIVGSFGWGNKIVNQLSDLLKDLKAEFLPPLLIKGYPKNGSLEEINKLADTIYEKHQELS